MRIERVAISNLRGFKALSIELHPKLTVLVGPNNAGKTTVLDAVGAVLGYRKGISAFTEDDFRAETPRQNVREAPPIVVDLTIAPTSGPKFRRGELGTHSPILEGEEERVLLRLTVKYDGDPAVQAIDGRLEMLNAEGGVIRDLASFPFRDELPFRPFGPDRDLRRGFGGRWSDWGHLLADVRPRADVYETAAALLKQGSDHLIEQTEGLKEVRTLLAPAGKTVGLPDTTVSLSAAPQDLDQILRQVVVELRLPGAGRGFNADRHGHGTQGALLFAVYLAYVKRILKADSIKVSPVLTVEEPEAHLHPTAQRVIARQLSELPGQVIATSHSPELVQAPASSIVLLRTSDGQSFAKAVSAAERAVRDHPRALFARCVVVVEGMGEVAVLPWFALALGHDLALEGIEVVNAGGQASIPKLWACFGPAGLGLPIVCVADADQPKPLVDFLRCVRTTDSTVIVPDPGDVAALQRRLAELDYFTSPWGTKIEHVLVDQGEVAVDQAFADHGDAVFATWKAGHGNPEISLSSDREARIKRLADWKDGMGPVARLLTNDGTDRAGVPPCYEAAIERAVALARG
jgi:putative ATP-dependent endonuclease of the OLD family